MIPARLPFDADLMPGARRGVESTCGGVANRGARLGHAVVIVALGVALLMGTAERTTARGPANDLTANAGPSARETLKADLDATLPTGAVDLEARPPLVPSERARRAAFAWAARRAGRVAVAVVDSRGHLYGYHHRVPFWSASVVKAMLLVAYLREHRTVSTAMRGVLRRMIEHSDNDAADIVYRAVGRRGLAKLARLAGMRGFHTTAAWITTQVTAADMALFFRDMERWLPERHRHFADWLLAHVTPYRALGHPCRCRSAWLPRLLQAGLDRRLGAGQSGGPARAPVVRLGLAVFTDKNPTSTYGKETIAGVTRRLLRR